MTAQTKRSVNAQLYKVIVKGTKDGVFTWERVGEGDTDFISSQPKNKGGDIRLTFQQAAPVRTADDDDSKVVDDGYRWVITAKGVSVTLNLKQRALARHVIEQIDGTSDDRQMAELDALADSLADAFGIDLDSSSDEDE